MAKATVAAWRHATLNGETAAMVAPTRAGVDVLNELAQYERITAGEIDLRSRSVKVGTSRAHVGDLVATRRNDRTLLTDENRMVKNRDRWTVETVHDDGRLTVTGPTGRVTLPADYVAAHVELAYAETSHATQGRTVDRSFLFLDGPTGASGIYVPLTRGRTTNEAFVVLRDECTPAEVVADAVARTWIDQPATVLRLDQAIAAEQARPRRPLPVPDLRRLVEQVTAAGLEVTRLDYGLNTLGREQSDIIDEQHHVATQIVDTERCLAEARRAFEEHYRPVRRRGHRSALAHARRDIADLPDRLNRLEDRAAELKEHLTANDRSARSELIRVERQRVVTSSSDSSMMTSWSVARPPRSTPT